MSQVLFRQVQRANANFTGLVTPHKRWREINSFQFLNQDGAGALDDCTWVYEQHSHYSAIVTHFTNLIIMEGHY